MNIGIMLTIIGISATIILGLLAILITVRFNKKVQVTFIYDRCISLLEEITKNIPGLKIFYKDEVIDLILDKKVDMDKIRLRKKNACAIFTNKVTIYNYENSLIYLYFYIALQFPCQVSNCFHSSFNF